MRRTNLLGVGALLLSSASPASAQSNVVHSHIGQVAFAFAEAPNGQGLLTTAVTEAAIAAQHAELANEAGASLADVQLHVGHMLHAIDPALAIGGPGLGYGVRLAASSAAARLTIAASDPTASDNVRMHADGLRQATFHMTLLERGEGLIP